MQKKEALCEDLNLKKNVHEKESIHVQRPAVRKAKSQGYHQGRQATSFLSLPLLQENIFKHAPDRRGLKSQAELKWNCCWKFLSTFCHPFSLQYSRRKSVIRVTSLCVNVHTQLCVCIRAQVVSSAVRTQCNLYRQEFIKVQFSK